MPSPPIFKGKIDVTKIDKSAMFKSAKTGAVYLDFVCWEKASDYDDDGIIKQDPASTFQGDKQSLPILGNFTIGALAKGGEASEAYCPNCTCPDCKAAAHGRAENPQEDEDDIPF